MVDLEAGEQVLHEIYKVWYETHERTEKTFKGKPYADKGVLKLTNTSLIFEGKKVQLRMKKVTSISRKKTALKVGSGEGYVKIDYTDKGGKKSTYLLGGAVAVWSRKKSTDNLYNTLLHWLQSEKTEVQYMPRCPRCMQVATYAAPYKKWYCQHCQTYL